MLLGWFDARKATDVGIALADQFTPQRVPEHAQRGKRRQASGEKGEDLRELLRVAEREIPSLRLNFYKKAKLANSFKWRLLEKGIRREMADEVTQTLVMHLSLSHANSASGRDSLAGPADRPSSNNARHLLDLATECVARGAYAEAINAYRDLIRLNPRHAIAMNNSGAALCKLGRFEEAERYFRRAIEVKPNYPEAHGNLGAVLRIRGRLTASEHSLRRALKLKPTHVDGRVNLGMTLLSDGRPAEARVHFEKVLKIAPRNTEALLGIGQITANEGRFEAAEISVRRVLETNPNSPGAWSALAGLRKMTPADSSWLQRAQQIVAGGVEPLEEATVRFAMGKYCDDLADFGRAFENYQRANDLLKGMAESYDRNAHSSLNDALMRAYTRDTIARSAVGASDSMKPVFVVGMMRSGTSLAEQIIASHPEAKGAGELGFWSDTVQQHGAALRQGPFDEPMRRRLAQAYLHALARPSGDAPRIVDKAPINSDYLGLIHSVFPHARIIYMRRHPIDTCLSCYFQQFALSVNFTLDLSDLAYYYRQHQRLMAHWRTVLPPGSILEVPYAELVTDQEGWSRRILDFLGLEWNERCLDFQNTKRVVATASSWQVRQKIYRSSVERWRNYAKFIGPLRQLEDLDR